MATRLNWSQDGHDWPHREHSAFVVADGLRWHVQRFESRASNATTPPWMVLIHGTGASTHSWRDLIPLLTSHYSVLAMDLPGHAFTDMPSRGSRSPQFSLPGMAQALAALLKEVAVQPRVVVGHSAGAALAVEMAASEAVVPQHLVSLNGALLPLPGLAGAVFSPVAKLMAATPWVPRLFSRQASDPRVLDKLIESTGSRMDAQGLTLYGRLVRNPGHAAGALAMMANWDLPHAARQVSRLPIPLRLIVGLQDRTITPREAHRVWAMLPADARHAIHELPGLGHLAHEERPDLVAAVLLEGLGTEGPTP